MKNIKIKFIALAFLFISCGNPELTGFSESPDFDSNNPAQIIDILEADEQSSENVCDLADNLIEDCTGVRPQISSSCSENESYAARAILDSGCDTIINIEII